MANYNLKSSLINKCVGFGFNGGTNFSGSGSGRVAVAVTVKVVVAFMLGSGDFSNSYKVPNKNENFKLVFNKTCPFPKIGGMFYILLFIGLFVLVDFSYFLPLLPPRKDYKSS